MVGKVTPIQTGMPHGPAVPVPMWFRKFYSRVGAPDSYYVADWMNLPGAQMRSGPNRALMELIGTGTDPVTAAAAELGGAQAIGPFNANRRIDTKHPGSKNFTFIGITNLLASQLNGGAGAQNRMASRPIVGATDCCVLITGTGQMQMSLASGVAATSAALDSSYAGPAVIMATCREVGVNTYLLRIYLNNLNKPIGENVVTHTMDVSSNWTIGGAAGAGVPWTSKIHAWKFWVQDITYTPTEALANRYAAIWSLQDAMRAAA